MGFHQFALDLASGVLSNAVSLATDFTPILVIAVGILAFGAIVSVFLRSRG